MNASEGEINAEQDDLQAVATKLGVEEYQGRDKITPTEKQLEKINGELDEYGNTCLIAFSKLGKSDVVEFLLKFEGILVNHENKDDETAAEVAKDARQFVCLLKLLEADSLFPMMLDADEVDDDDLKAFLLKRKNLHACIEVGDIQGVKDALNDQKPSIYLNNENQSALFCAAENEQMEIFAHLLSIGAKFKDREEEESIRIDQCNLEKLNDILQDQFLQIDDYHLLKLLYRSKSPQALTDKRYDILKGIYDYLSQFDVINLIMKVLEYEDIDVVFDFESEHTNNIYCMNNCYIYGLTVPSIKRIFMGAKQCLSTDGLCKEVAGTLAHELCHMAMDTLYRNGAKPYADGEESSSIRGEYQCVIKEMSKSYNDMEKDINEIIRNVFNCYYPEQWEPELIVRVPHILAAYGEEKGKQILQTQAKGLYDFYLNYVVSDSRGYNNPAFYKRALCGIEYMHIYHGCISEADKVRNPFKIPLKTFRNSMIRVGVMHVIFTNIIRLCALHIYHERKVSQRYQMDKSCLFFRLDCFLKHEKEILKAFRCSVCTLMVLVCHDKLVDIDSLASLFDDIETENKEIILVVGKDCEILTQRQRKKSLDYHWKDLSEEYKKECSKRTVNLKGNKSPLLTWTKLENLSKIVESDDIARLIAEETIMIGDGRKVDSRGYKSYYYIERDLAKLKLDTAFFRELPETTVLYVTGLSKKESSGMNLDAGKVQWLKDTDKNIDGSKQIFVRETKGKTSFSDEFDRIQGNPKHWVHYSEKNFHVVTLRGQGDDITKYLRRTDCSEEKLIKSSKDRVVLISDDPGTGKSTLLASVIEKINDYSPKCWVARIDLIDHALDGDEEEKIKPKATLENIKAKSRPEVVLDIFFRMAGLSSNLDIFLMKLITKSKDLGSKCKVFLDGYDEVSSLFKENLFNLFGTLMKETNIQLWITTRVHEKNDLEAGLGTCSLSLVQFSDDRMITFLDKLWKHSLLMSECIKNEVGFLTKMDRLREKIDGILEDKHEIQDPLHKDLEKVISELEDDSAKISWDEKLEKIRNLIEGLDFKSFAYYLIQRSSIKDEDTKFIGIPLHLSMLGSVAYDKNLRVDVYSDLYGLYTEFVKSKLEVYRKEKLKMTINTVEMKIQYESIKKKVLNLHMNVARIVLQGRKKSKINKEDVKDDHMGVSVGILTKTGENFQFIHRTFAEYFFAEWILLNMEENILVEVMYDVKYELVRKFLSSAVEREDRKVEMAESSFKKLKMEAFFINFAKKPMIRDSNASKLFRKILQAFEDVCDEKSMDDFIFKFAKFLSQKSYCDYIGTFWFLRECLTDKMLADLFGRHIELTIKHISIIIMVCKEDELKEVLGELERVFRSRSRDEIEYDSNSEHDEDDSSKKSEEQSSNELILNFVRCRNASGYGLLHAASKNSDENVFTVVLELLERVVDEEEVKRCISETTKDGSNIMHCSAMNGAVNMQAICSSIEGKVSVIDLLNDEDERGRNVLHVAAKNLQPLRFYWLLDFFYRVDEGVTLKRKLIQVNKKGKTILHYVCKYRTPNAVDEILPKLKDYLGEKEIKDLMMRSDDRRNNIFHVFAMGALLYDLSVFRKYFDNEELTKLLLQVNNCGLTCLHQVLWHTHLDTPLLISNLNELSRVLGPESFQELLLTRDERGANISQYLKEGIGLFVDHDEIIDCIRNHIPESAVQELIKVLPSENKC